jgi:hypothetical protein
LRLRALPLLLAFGFAAHASAAGSPPVDTPAAAATRFYRAYLAAHPEGLTEPAIARDLAPHLSRSLARLLAAAAAAEARHARASRGEEPPLWEGDAFSSMFEGATDARVGECREARGVVRCSVQLAYRDPAGGEPERWQDQVVLVRENGRYAVDDIAYGGTWDFRNMGTLRASLRDVAAYRAGTPAHKPRH